MVARLCESERPRFKKEVILRKEIACSHEHTSLACTCSQRHTVTGPHLHRKHSHLLKRNSQMTHAESTSATIWTKYGHLVKKTVWYTSWQKTLRKTGKRGKVVYFYRHGEVQCFYGARGFSLSQLSFLCFSTLLKNHIIFQSMLLTEQ